VILSAGSFFIKAKIRELNSLEHPVAYGRIELIAKFAISCEVAEIKGGFPCES